MTGVVIGKFLPFHKGHEALIKFALSKCSEVDVYVCFEKKDPISFVNRVDWIARSFPHKLRVMSMNCMNMPNSDEPDEYVARYYAQWLNTQKKYDFVFTSESYGELMVKHMPAKHILFDIDRKKFPIRGRDVLKNPYDNWDMLPEAVQRYFTLKVCIYGSESVGKSTLTKYLAKKFKTAGIQEYAREVLNSNAEVTEKTLTEIAYGQAMKVKEAVETGKPKKVIFSDTDAITTEIYSWEYLGHIIPAVFQAQAALKYDYYLFPQFEGTPWVGEPLRDFGHRRQEIQDKFKHALETRGILYTPLSGVNFNQRNMQAFDTIQFILKHPYYLETQNPTKKQFLMRGI